MKGIVRSLEAMLAIMLLFISLSTFFRVAPEEDAPMARYHSIVEDTLDVYSDMYRFLVFNRPHEIDDFTRSVLPDYVNYRAEVEYVQPLDFFTGLNDTNVPLKFYLDYPVGTDTGTIRVYDGRHELPVQQEFNWFRIQFFVENDAAPKTDHEVTFQLVLPFRDSNLDGLLEPVDPASIDVFFKGQAVAFDSQVDEISEDSLTVSISFLTDLQSEEISSGYVYYLVGDVV